MSDAFTRLQAFIAVADAQGFSAAARELGRSKALLSKLIRELEDDLGTLLLNRTTRQLSLTEAGRLYCRTGQEILSQLEELHDQVRDTGSELTGQLRISAPQALSESRMELPLTRFAQKYPGLSLDIDLDDRVVDLVEEGFDIAIRSFSLPDSSLIARRLADIKLVVCAAPETLAAFGQPQKPSDLANKPCIVDTNLASKASWPFVDQSGKEYAVAVSGSIKANSPAVVRAAALAGLGFAYLPKFSIENELREGRLIELLANHVPDIRGLYVVYPHRRHVPAKVRTFVDFVADWYKHNEFTSES